MWEWLLEKLGQLAQSRSRTFLVWLVAFLAGVAVHAFYERPMGGVAVMTAVVVGAAVFSLIARLDRRVVLICTAIALAAIGCWRYDTVWRSSAYATPPPTVVGEHFEGIIIGYVRERERNTLLTVQTEFGLARLYVRTPLTYKYGDQIRWGCRPRLVSADDDGWHDRLLLDGVRWTCSVYDSPVLIKTPLSQGVRPGWEDSDSSANPNTIRSNGLKDVIYRLKRGVVASVQRILPEPEASFLLGLLIGVKDGLPEELTESFRNTGTTHILAVSGYNVTQLINVGVLLLALILVPRRKSAAVMAVAVIIFACVVGGDASVIRAAVMGCVGILATLYRRRYSGARALLAAAALMLAVNPLVLKHDVGFQLSFVAVWGLHALAPGLLGLFPSRWRNVAVRILCETGSATLATAPVILYSFGRLPAVGLLANLLILPLIPWAMLFGALAATIGLVSVSLALVPALIAAWIMLAVEFVAISLARHVPLALEVQVGAVTVGLLYVWLIILAFALARRGYEKKS